MLSTLKTLKCLLSGSFHSMLFKDCCKVLDIAEARCAEAYMDIGLVRKESDGCFIFGPLSIPVEASGGGHSTFSGTSGCSASLAEVPLMIYT